MRNRRITIGILAGLAVIALARHPTADIKILTHDATDRAPHQIRAALDLGLVAVSVLVTWTGTHLS
ncbi:hypothetical protein [Sphingomonas sp.]|uniref:hypothetical protein n=1 Tax=Sphingomonas sp. TaxID=28214 RepID=UPI0035664BDB